MKKKIYIDGLEICKNSINVYCMIKKSICSIEFDILLYLASKKEVVSSEELFEKSMERKIFR